MFHQRIVEQLKQFVSGASDTIALERWILSNYQHILDSGEEAAIVLANELNALFIEQGEHLLSPEELEFAIAEILLREDTSVSLQLGENPVRAEAAKTVRKQLQTAGQVTDVHLTMEAA